MGGTDAVVIVVIAVGVDAIDFGTAEIVVSLANAKELFGEPNIAEFNPGNEILCILDVCPVAPHSSRDNRFAPRFFFAFNS